MGSSQINIIIKMTFYAIKLFDLKSFIQMVIIYWEHTCLRRWLKDVNIGQSVCLDYSNSVLLTI